MAYKRKEQRLDGLLFYQADMLDLLPQVRG